MNSINLVPRAFVEACERRRRIRNWMAACGATAGVVCMAATTVFVAGSHAAQARAAAVGVDEQRVELQRKVVAATRRRDELVAKATTIAAIRREHRLAGQLVALAERTPDGVRLTRFASRAAEPATASRPAKPSAADAPRTAVTEIAGYAADHEQLNRFLRMLQEISDWGDVSLRRATTEKFGNGQAVAFQIECRQRRGTP